MGIKPIAVLVSDIHLSKRPPPCRTDKYKWMDVMHDYLKQLEEPSLRFNIPIVAAGDIFDEWNSDAELINFAMLHVPKMYAIPGQHDLPYHSLDQIEKSAYWSLCLNGNITNLPADSITYPTESRKLGLVAFPWGATVAPFDRESRYCLHPEKVHLAVVHKYIWQRGHGYVGADKKYSKSAYKKSLNGFDAALFGDNHKRFLTKIGDTHVLNNGGFMIRKSDELEARPGYGLLMSDGTIMKVALDTRMDDFQHIEKMEETEVGIDTSALFEELKEAGAEGSLDFRETVNRLADASEITNEAKDIIKEALEA